MTPPADRELQDFVRDCASLHADFEGVLEDLRLSSWKYNVRYAIDFSELYAYVYPHESADQLKMFSDDPRSTTEAVQQYVLKKLLFNSDQRLLLLPTYAIELQSFVNFVKEHAVVQTLQSAPAVLQEIQAIENDDEFTRVESLIVSVRVKDAQLSEHEWQEILTFLEERAPTLVRLSESRELDPLERLGVLLRRVSFEPLGALVEVEGAVDEANIREWERALEDRRRQRSGSNYLDAMAVELLRAANGLLQRSNIRIRLITRSRAMHDVARDLQPSGGWNSADQSLLRHPRAFFALRRAEGVSSEQAVDRVLLMQTSLEAVIDSYRRNRTMPATRDGADVASMIAEIRQLLHGGASLASVMAVAEATEAEADGVARSLPAATIQERVLRLFAVLRDEETLMQHLEDKARERAEGIDRLQQLLAVALQGQPEAARGSVSRSVQYDREGTGTVIKSNLYWMPYTLEFQDPALQQWSREFEQRASVSLGEMLEMFRSGFARNLDYEMLLSLAYLVAAWGQWELALKFADLALTRRRLTPNIPANEGRFFKALCLRMLGAETGAHYREARRLLQQARLEKRRQTGAIDPRYVKETATLLFAWGEVLSRQGDALTFEAQRKEDMAVRLSQRALELAQDDPGLTSQIYNNLCYYFTNNPARAGGGEIRDYLDRLAAQLDQSAPERWPINFVDTVLWAHCNLPDSDISADYWRVLINTLDRASREQRIRGAEQQSIRKHLAHARQRLHAVQGQARHSRLPAV